MTDPPRAPPAWLTDGIGVALRELRAYLTTAWQFARKPHTFIQDWWSGRITATNPLAMLATGAAIVAGSRQLAGTVLGIDHADSFSSVLLSALGPYVHYVVIGVLCHVVLRLRSRQPVRVTDSVAAALYAGAGPTALAEAAGWLVLCALAPLGVTPLMVGIMIGTAFSVFCVTFATALGGLHRTVWWIHILAFGVAFPATGLAFGLLDPPGNYGLHWVIHFRGGFHLGLGL